MAVANDIARALEGALNATISATAARLAQNIVGELVRANPKDTRWSSVNWVSSAGTPAGGGFLSHLTREMKLSFVPYQAVEQASQLAALGSYDHVSQGDIYITNEVAYLEFLDAGSSPQASPGWIRVGIEEGIAKTPLVVVAGAITVRP